MKNHHWYRVLLKPSWAPPAWLFAPVWTTIYVLMAISFGYVGFLYVDNIISPGIMTLFLLNLLLNMSFTPILFGFHRLGLASLDVLFVLITLVWGMILIFPFAPWVAFANIPYLVWMIFATVLQFKIAAMNQPGRSEVSFAI